MMVNANVPLLLVAGALFGGVLGFGLPIPRGEPDSVCKAMAHDVSAWEAASVTADSVLASSRLVDTAAPSTVDRAAVAFDRYRAAKAAYEAACFR